MIALAPVKVKFFFEVYRFFQRFFAKFLNGFSVFSFAQFFPCLSFSFNRFSLLYFSFISKRKVPKEVPFSLCTFLPLAGEKYQKRCHQGAGAAYLCGEAHKYRLDSPSPWILSLLKTPKAELPVRASILLPTTLGFRSASNGLKCGAVGVHTESFF